MVEIEGDWDDVVDGDWSTYHGFWRAETFVHPTDLRCFVATDLEAPR